MAIRPPAKVPIMVPGTWRTPCLVMVNGRLVTGSLVSGGRYRKTRAYRAACILSGQDRTKESRSVRPTTQASHRRTFSSDILTRSLLSSFGVPPGSSSLLTGPFWGVGREGGERVLDLVGNLGNQSANLPTYIPNRALRASSCASNSLRFSTSGVSPYASPRCSS